MTITSANPDDLSAFIDGSATSTGQLRTSLTNAIAKANAVSAACSFNHPSTPSVSSADGLLVTWQENDAFVTVVHNELVAADTYDADGNAVVAAAVIDATLQAHGLDDAPDIVEADAVEMYGLPPYSGFVDDPICLANGNFVHGDRDLDFHGFATALDVTRMYNSRAHTRTGVFGPGWWSPADLGLVVEERYVEFADIDGGGTRFVRLDDGGFAPDRRRRLRLEELADGYEVREGHDRWWRFTTDGVLRAFGDHAADVTVSRDEAAVRFDDATTGRSVTYRIDPATGRVVEVTSSDGRTVTYDYDDGGHLLAARRVVGDVTYTVEDGLITEVHDADGVLVCRNTYDADGRVLTQVESHGRETAYEYRADGVATVTAADGSPPNVMVHDRRGRLTAMIDGLGNTMRLAYGDGDDIVQRVDRTGAETRYRHDERGNLVERLDPDGRSHRWEWDDLDRLVSETDRAGNATSYRYTGDQRSPSTIAHADGSEVRATYDERQLPVTVTDADGVSTAFEWNTDGRLTAIVDPLGARTEFAYDGAGRSVRARNPEGIFASLGLDRAGRVRSVRTADGEETFEYTTAGRMQAGTMLGGARWTAEFDTAGEVATFRESAGDELHFERNSTGAVTATVTTDGARREYAHDPAGRIVTSTDPFGDVVEVTYDAEGRMVRVDDVSGRTRTREVDVFGRTVVSRAPGGAEQRRRYHPNGELAEVTDAEGHVWRYDVDAMGRVTAATDPLGAVTTYTYTPAGRLRTVRSPLGRTVERRYDAAGRLATIVEPDGSEVQFERRADGKVVRVLRDGVATSFDHDAAGRGSAVVGPWGELDLEHEGDTVTAIADPATTPASFTWDPRQLLARAADPAGVVTEFVRDARGRVSSHTTSGRTTEFGHDLAGRIESVTDPAGRTTRYRRDGRGFSTETVLPDGTGRRYRYGDDGRLAAVDDLADRELVAYRRDRRGLVVGASSGDVESSLEHDPLGRVTAVSTDAGTVRYEWDADGVLAARTDDDGPTVALQVDDRGALVGHLVDGVPVALPERPDLERDAGGRVTLDEHGRRYDYDVAGRLERSVTADGAVTTYAYDDLGLLASEHDDDGVRRYSYGPSGELLVRTDPDGRRTSFEYDGVGRRVLETRDDGSSVRYGYDDLGRLTQVVSVDTEGTETRRRVDYDPFGRPMRVDGTPVLWDTALTGNLLGIGRERYLWSGKHVRVIGDDGDWDRRIPDDPWGDDGGDGLRLGYRGELALDHLVFLGARVYDTRARCFLSRDPLPPVPGAVTFASAYAYAWNDPVNLVDPSGRRPLSDDEYASFREQAAKGTFEQAWDTMVDDPWGTLAMVAVVGVAIAVGGPVGAGIAAGMILSAGVGLATGTFNPRTVAINGVIGGVTGGIGSNLTLGRMVAVEAAGGMTGSVAEQTLVNGRSLTDIDLGQVVLAGGLSGGFAGTIRVAGDLRTGGLSGGADDATRTVPTSTLSDGLEHSDAPLRMADQPFGGTDPDIAVIGRRADTEVAESWDGHEVLNDPNWTITRNDEWVQSVVQREMPVYVGSPETKANLFDAVEGRPTVFGREVEQFLEAGYVRDGDYLLPPGS